MLDPFNTFGYFLCIGLSMEDMDDSSCVDAIRRAMLIGQLLKLKACLKNTTIDRTLKGFTVAMLNIRKAFIPCTWML